MTSGRPAHGRRRPVEPAGDGVTPLRSRVRAWLLPLAVVALTAAGCGAQGDGAASGRVSGELVVFAAASLNDAFDALGDAFGDEYPDVEVVANFAGSQTLASQIAQGAPADVFAAANTTQMDVVAAAGGLSAAPEVFTTNRLEIAVEPGNPLGIDGLADLTDPGLQLVLPAEEVPAGSYARQALEAAGVTVTPSSLERDVRAALAKVELGEADAAVVYASDLVVADGRAEGVPIPPRYNVAAAYPIAVLADAPNPATAAAFVDFVLGDQGREILAAHGFSAP